ncbi:MAG TPA: hypothetical protein VM864_11740 [Pyrinomonadaceae bacterium]|jgi:hypothetical protein|nr:hypothetical protein [Pyrinomonadaceae bacterium]
MQRGFGRIARAALAPKAVILGLATFQFGWALTEFVLPVERHYSSDREVFMFLFFALLIAAACLTAAGEWGRLAAAFLCSPMPLVHAFIFWAPRPHVDVAFFSVDHIRLWLADLARADVSIWALTAVSFAILGAVAASALRSPSKPRAPGCA